MSAPASALPTRQPSPTPTLTSKAASPPHDKPVALSQQSPPTYEGSGSVEDPYIVVWLPGEDADPYNWPKSKKWVITGLTAWCTLVIALASSIYSGASRQMVPALHVSTELYIAGISLFVVGFGAGPLLWAPISEMYGRRAVFLASYSVFAIFQIGTATAQNIETVLITRFFAGFFGAAPLVNSGGVIADMWSFTERGTASALFALAPFLGPVLGPIIGGFAAPTGWRHVFWIMFAIAGATFVINAILVPETYAPALLRHKAKELTMSSGGSVQYMSKLDKLNNKTTAELFKINLSRPFVLLFTEPIVLLLSIYTALIYGILYMMFAAFPIVFQQVRGWSSGVGGLAFIGIGIGMVIATAISPFNNRMYRNDCAKSPTGRAPPEARLRMAMIGSVCLPVSLFWFAWTSNPSVHWISPVMAGAPFGFGLITVFTSVINYLIDCYLLYAASALAANAVLRSLLGAAFPLFTTYMYRNLGYDWASTLVGFLALACTPMPFLFYKYGASIRARSKFSPTGKPAAPPAPQATLPPAPAGGEGIAAPAPANEKSVVDAPLSADTAYEPEYGPDAGMPEEREQQQQKMGHSMV